MAMDLGRYGIWQRAGQLVPELAGAVEALGFGTIWIAAPLPGISPSPSRCSTPPTTS